MNRKTTFFALMSVAALSAVVSFKPSHTAAAKADANTVDYSSWYVLNANNHYQFTPNADNEVKLLIYTADAEADGLVYTDTATSINGASDKGYLNDHRNALTDGAGNQLIDYMTLNGRKISDIIDDNKNGVTNYKGVDNKPEWVFTLGGQYCPITVEINHNIIYVTVMGAYLVDQGLDGNELYIGFEAGAPFRDASYNLYTLDTGISAIASSINANEKEYFAPVTDQKCGDENGYLFFRDATYNVASCGEHGTALWLNRKLSQFAGRWILDHYTELTSFITINGETIAHIYDRIDDSSWDYSSYQLAGGDDATNMYNRPIRLNVDNDNPSAIWIYAHPNYWATFNVGDTITLGIKKGFSYQSEGTMYYQAYDTETAFTFNGADGSTDPLTIAKTINRSMSGDFTRETMSVTSISNVTVDDFQATGYYGISIAFDKNFAKATCYDFDDGNGSTGANVLVQKFITINGETVASINANWDDSALSYDCFPQNADNLYAVPVLLKHLNDNSIDLMIHKGYLDTLGNSVTVGVKSGLTVFNADLDSEAGTHVSRCEGVKVVGSDASQVVTLTNDYYYVNDFVTNYMHMNDVSTDTVTDTGACKGATGYYALAKTALNALTAAQRKVFATNADFAAAYARLQAWAAANGETLTIDADGAVQSARVSLTSTVTATPVSYAAIISVTAVVTALGAALLLLKKKKHD